MMLSPRSRRRGAVWPLVLLGLALLLLVGVSVRILRQRPRAQRLTLVGPHELAPGQAGELLVRVRDADGGEPLAGARVTLTLTDAQGEAAGTAGDPQTTDASGELRLGFAAPTAAGRYTVRAVSESPLGRDAATLELTVERRLRLRLALDQPSYRPGQRLRVRVLVLAEPQLAPLPGEALTLSVRDARHRLLLQQVVRTSGFGIAAADLPLDRSLPAGELRVSARLGTARVERTVTVGEVRRVPFAVSLSVRETSVAPGGEIIGEVGARLHAGGPMVGARVTVRALDDSGRMRTLTAGQTDPAGRLRLSLPAPGSPSPWTLVAEVADLAGRRAEARARIVPPRLRVGVVASPLDGRVFVWTRRADDAPVPCDVTVHASGKPVALQTGRHGVAVWAPAATHGRTVRIEAVDAGGERVTQQAWLPAAPAGLDLQLRSVRRAAGAGLPRAGETLTIELNSARGGPALLALAKGPQLVLGQPLTLAPGRQTVSLQLPTALAGVVRLIAARADDGRLRWSQRLLRVLPAQALSVAVELDRTSYRPGETARLRLRVTDPAGRPVQAALSLSMVDPSVAGRLPLVGPGPVLAPPTEQLEAAASGFDQPPTRWPLSVRELFRAPVDDAESLAAEATLALWATAFSREPLGLSVAVGADVRQLTRRKRRYVGALAGTWFGTGALLPAIVALWLLGVGLLGRPAAGPQGDAQAGSLAEFRAAFGVGFWLPLWGLALAALVSGGLPPRPLQTPAGVGAALATAAAIATMWAVLVALRPGPGPKRRITVDGGRLRLWLPLALAALVVPGLLGGNDFRRKTVAEMVLWLVTIGLALQLVRMLRAYGGLRESRRCQPGFGLPLAILVAAVAGMTAVIAGAQLVERLDGPRWVERDLLGMAAAAGGIGWLLVGPVGAMSLRAAAERLSRRAFMGGLGLRLGALAVLLLPPVLSVTTLEGGRPMAGREADTMSPGDPEGATGAGRPLPPGGPAGDEYDLPQPVREWFPETLLWQPERVTDADGRLELRVKLADTVTRWQLEVEAIGRSGGLAVGRTVVVVTQPLVLDPVLPARLTTGDQLALPVTITRHAGAGPVRVAIRDARGFAPLGAAEQTVELAAGQSRTLFFGVAASAPGAAELTVEAEADGARDAVRRTATVRPAGHAVAWSRGGRLSGEATQALVVPATAVPGTGQLEVELYPGLAALLLDGLDGMVGVPHGCFEQTSSVSYPNVLVMDLLRRQGRVAPGVLAACLERVRSGYQRILTFERPHGGFDWWGQGDPQVWLTAYGVQQLAATRRVIPVDARVLRRANAFLKRQQAEDGSWRPSGRQAGTRLPEPRLALTAHVVWALADAGQRGQVVQRGARYLRARRGHAEGSPYHLALVVLALATLDRADPALAELLSRLEALARRDATGVWWPAVTRTGSLSHGVSARAETTALATLALLTARRAPALSGAALRWLIGQRRPGGAWASTQATIFALRALVAAERWRTVGGEATVEVHLGERRIARWELTDANRELLRRVVVPLPVGRHSVTLTVDGKAELLYQVVGRYLAPPRADADARRPLALDVRWPAGPLAAGKPVPLTATLQHRADEPTHMVMVELGLPPGFGVDAAALAALQEKELIARWERDGDRLALYLEHVAASSTVVLPLRLIAGHAGRVAAPASVAYEYYAPQVRAVAPGPTLIVE